MTFSRAVSPSFLPALNVLSSETTKICGIPPNLTSLRAVMSTGEARACRARRSRSPSRSRALRRSGPAPGRARSRTIPGGRGRAGRDRVGARRSARQPRRAEEGPDRLRLAHQRLRHGRVVEQHDAAVTPRNRLEPGLDRLDLARRLGVDLAQERLAEVGELCAGESADEALWRRRSRAPARRSRARRARAGGPGPPHPRAPRSARRTGSRGSRGCRAPRRPAASSGRQASASTAACSGSPCVVRSPASRITSACPFELGERVCDPLAQGLGAVDVSRRGDTNRLGHRPPCSLGAAFTNGERGYTRRTWPTRPPRTFPS